MWYYQFSPHDLYDYDAVNENIRQEAQPRARESFRMEVTEAKRLRQLEEENGQLKHIVAEQAVDIRGFKGVVAKKW